MLKILQIRNSHRLNGYVRVLSLKSRHCIQKNPLIDAVCPKGMPNLQARRLCVYFRAKTRDRQKQCRHQQNQRPMSQPPTDPATIMPFTEYCHGKKY